MACLKTSLSIHRQKHNFLTSYLKHSRTILCSRKSETSQSVITCRNYNSHGSPWLQSVSFRNRVQSQVFGSQSHAFHPQQLKLTTQSTCCLQIQNPDSSGSSFKRHYSTMNYSESVHVGIRDDATKIFQSAVTSVLPRQMIDQALAFDTSSSSLEVQGTAFPLNHNVYVVGFGKAVLGMARAVDDILSEHIVQGILSVPVGIQQCFKDVGKSGLLLSEKSKIMVYEGAKSNLPDSASLLAAQAIHQLVSGLQLGDILIVLISGGGSALLPSPHPPITLEEEMAFTRLLAASGATIQELNTIRKHIEVLKGGGLAKAAKPAKVLSLILSDVIGDPLDIIASGPTVKDSSTISQCLSLIDKFKLSEKTPQSILSFMKSISVTAPSHTSAGRHLVDNSEEASLGDVSNIVVGSNKIAVEAASLRAQDMGYLPVVLTTGQEGNATEVGTLFATLARFVCLLMRCKRGDKCSRQLSETEVKLVGLGLSKDRLNTISNAVKKADILVKSVCLIAGGETTVNVQGSGIGGRNQEMALSCALAMKETILESDITGTFKVQFLSGGTDGIDGPTDAAGAVVGPDFCDIALQEGFDSAKYLHNNDSYSLLSKVNQGSNLIRTGHTGTNVMDLQILLIKPN